MDLPTCPHCGQSVLDDDVDECPFCGESLSSKSTGKKPATAKASPAPTPAAKAATEQKSAAKEAKKPKPKAEAKADKAADEPFAVDQMAMSNAVPLRPKPSPGRTYKVVCPMCETEGFTSPKAGGREVKCANPKCLVPIFTCPEPPPEPVKEPEPAPAGLSTTQLGLISAVALIGIGFGVWFFVLKDDNPKPDPKPEIAQKTTPEGNKTESAPEDNGPKTVTPPQPKGPDFSKFLAQVPEKMIRVSELPSGRGIVRPKPLRVQAIALTLTDLGQLNEAEAQLDRMKSFNDDEPHYRVLPWVEIGWKLREEEKSATEAASKALEFSADVSRSLHESWLEAVSLTALLAALGRSDETAALMNRKFGRAQDQELWADLVTVALDGTFDLDRLEPVRPLVTPKNPAWQAVVWQLVFHEAESEALDWATQAPDSETKADALIAYADAVTAHSIMENKLIDLSKMEAAGKTLPQSWPGIVTARAFARAGQRCFEAGDQPQAKTLLDTAQKGLASLPTPSPMMTPDLKGIYDGPFPDDSFTTPIAAAAFEVARLQASLKQMEPAWKSIEQGLANLRSTSLPVPVTQGYVQELKQADFLRSQLAAELNLSSDDAARQAFRTYQKNVNELHSRAEARLNLQSDLLAHAARWSLVEQVYKEITGMPDSPASDAYLQTDLPWVVMALLPESSSESKKSLTAALTEKKRTKPKGVALLEDSATWMESFDIPKLIDGLGRATPALADPVRRRWILRLCSQQVVKGEMDSILSVLLGLYKVDPFLGEDAAELLAGLAANVGQAQEMWDGLEQRDFSPTQKLAGYRGFVAAAVKKTEPETNE